MLLRHRLSGGRLRSIEDRIQSPEVSVPHHLSEVLFRRQEGGGHPPLDHSTVTPAADSTSSHANAGMRTLDDIGGSEATMQRRGYVQPVDREALLRPSSKLAAADGYSRSNHSASFFNRAMPVLASIFQAARST